MMLEMELFCDVTQMIGYIFKKLDDRNNLTYLELL